MDSGLIVPPDRLSSTVMRTSMRKRLDACDKAFSRVLLAGYRLLMSDACPTSLNMWASATETQTRLRRNFSTSRCSIPKVVRLNADVVVDWVRSHAGRIRRRRT